MYAAENVGNSIVLDGNDYAYSTGHIQKQFHNGVLIDQDYGTFKYDHDGSKICLNQYTSSTSHINDYGKSITINGCHIFVTGMAGDSGSSDIATIEMNTSDGVQTQLGIFDGTAGTGDRGVEIGTDGTYIYVAGVTNELATSSNQSDFVLLRYTPSSCTGGDNQTLNIKKSKLIPETFNLSQNYPNPFNPTTVINYALPKPSNISLRIYNELGQTLINIDSKYHDAGFYSETIDGTNLASGIYFYVIEARDIVSQLVTFTSAKKMLLIK